MIFNCLRKSISDKVFAKVTTEPERYKFAGTAVGASPAPFCDGPCFLKAIIDKTYTSTKASGAVARESLANLAEYMDALPDSNVIEFNEYVKKQTEILASGGETTTDLITNLFKGYAKSKDKTFREWIRIKKLAYFDNTFRIHPNCLDFMELAENHYKDAVLAKEWMRPDEDQQTILALQSKMEKVQAQASRSLKKREDKRRGGKIPKKVPSEWDWKHKAPNEGESKVKTVKGKTYHWCTNHQLWCLHKASECSLKAGEEKGKRKGKMSKDKLRMKVYQTLMEESSEEEHEEEEASNNESQEATSESE